MRGFGFFLCILFLENFMLYGTESERYLSIREYKWHIFGGTHRHFFKKPAWFVSRETNKSQESPIWTWSIPTSQSSTKFWLMFVELYLLKVVFRDVRSDPCGSMEERRPPRAPQSACRVFRYLYTVQSVVHPPPSLLQELHILLEVVPEAIRILFNPN